MSETDRPTPEYLCYDARAKKPAEDRPAVGPQVESKGSDEYPNKSEQAAPVSSSIAPPSTHSPTLARVPRYRIKTYELTNGILGAPIGGREVVVAEDYDALAAQLDRINAVPKSGPNAQLDQFDADKYYIHEENSMLRAERDALAAQLSERTDERDNARTWATVHEKEKQQFRAERDALAAQLQQARDKISTLNECCETNEMLLVSGNQREDALRSELQQVKAELDALKHPAGDAGASEA